MIRIFKLGGILPFSVTLVFFLTACSDDNKNTSARTAVQSPRHQFDHTHGAEVTDLVKHKFEHEFADQCVAREVRNSANREQDRERFAKPCMCIATYMMKDLTAKEAEKFIKEHKNTQSLRIRFENAAYHCLQMQNKSQPKAPVIFKRG